MPLVEAKAFWIKKRGNKQAARNTRKRRGETRAEILAIKISVPTSEHLRKNLRSGDLRGLLLVYLSENSPSLSPHTQKQHLPNGNYQGQTCEIKNEWEKTLGLNCFSIGQIQGYALCSDMSFLLFFVCSRYFVPNDLLVYCAKIELLMYACSH